MDLPLPPPPTLTTTHLHLTSPPAIQLQPPPPPRNPQQNQNQTQMSNQAQPNRQPSPLPRQPHSQRPDFSTVRPGDKSQDDWLRDSGHSNFHDFLEYYGFNQQDPEDVAMGTNFLQQIRRQEQEVWEERQARRGGSGSVTSNPTPTSGVSMNGLARPNSTSSNGTPGGNPMRTYDEGYRIKATYAVDENPMARERGGGGMQQQQQQHHGLMVGGMAMANRGMMPQRQIPRSSAADPRFHVPVATIAGRGVSETMLNAYGIKPWDLEAAGGKMHSDFTARYGR